MDDDDATYKWNANGSDKRVTDYIDGFVDSSSSSNSGFDDDDAVRAYNPERAYETNDDIVAMTDDGGNRSTPIYSISPDFIAQW